MDEERLIDKARLLAMGAIHVRTKDYLPWRTETQTTLERLFWRERVSHGEALRRAAFRQRFQLSGGEWPYGSEPLGGLLARNPSFGPIPCDGRPMFLDPLDSVITPTVLATGGWSQDELALLGRFLRSGDRAVDVGANIGTHASSFAEKVGPAGAVLALEADPGIVDLLMHNLQLNQLKQVAVRTVAAGATPGFASLHLGSATTGENSLLATSLSSSIGAIDVPVRPLDVLTSVLGAGGTIRLVKIDVQGAEPLVVEGGKGTFEADLPIAFIEYETHNLSRAGLNGRAMLEFFDNLDYAMFSFDALTGNRAATNVDEVSALPAYSYYNVLLVPRSDAVALRAAEAAIKHGDWRM